MLQDYTSATRANTFWSDPVVKLALGAAQDVVVNNMLRTGKKEALKRLVSTFAATGPVNLPANYLHFISSTISTPARTARVYIGGEGYTYLYTVHDAAVILGAQVYFVDRGNAAGTGVLHYYRRPNPLLVTGDTGFTTTQDFDLRIYDDIARYAVAILGTKETFNKRDMKMRTRVARQLGSEVPRGIHYPVDRDMAGGV